MFINQVKILKEYNGDGVVGVVAPAVRCRPRPTALGSAASLLSPSRASQVSSGRPPTPRSSSYSSTSSSPTSYSSSSISALAFLLCCRRLVVPRPRDDSESIVSLLLGATLVAPLGALPLPLPFPSLRSSGSASPSHSQLTFSASSSSSLGRPHGMILPSGHLVYPGSWAPRAM